MQIKVIDYGLSKKLEKNHYNDAGIDVTNKEDIEIKRGETKKVGLGFGLELPDGYMANIFPRSGLSSKGLTSELPPIDSGYRGEIHAILTLGANVDLEKIIDNDKIIKIDNETIKIKKGTRIAQIVVLPIICVELNYNDNDKQRGKNGFGSSGI